MAVEPHILLLRIRNEARNGEPPVWRGLLRDARGGRAAPFQDLAALPALIERFLTARPDDPRDET